jgi:hypothetical protein
MSAISGSLAAAWQTDAQNKATDANQQNVQDTNRTNLLLNMLARGLPIDAAMARTYGLPESVAGSGSALLPYYMGDTEQTLGTNAADLALAIQSLYDSPEAEMQDYENIMGRFAPDAAAADRAASDVVSGRTTQQMLDEAAPVFAARTDLANTRKNAALEQLKETLNDIDAIQARKGYSGDSYGNRMIKFNARRGIATAGAGELGQANLENALAKAAIQGQGRQMQLSSLDLPDRRAQSAILRRQMPGTAAAQRSQSSMAPLSFFNLGPHSFSPFQTPPQEQPVAGVGQILAQNSAALGNAGLGYLMQSDLQNRAGGYKWGGGGGGYGASSTSWGDGYGGTSGYTGSGTGYALTNQELDLGDY